MAVLSIKTVSGINSSQFEKPQFASGAGAGAARCRYQGAVYITVQWDYHSAQTHPEWLIRKPGGAHEGVPFTEAGFRQSLCVNTGYYNFFGSPHGRGVPAAGKRVGWIFFDIVGIRPCSCSACRAEMKRRGIDASNPDEVRKFC